MAPLFRFVQLEFTHSLGPSEGSYLIHPRNEREPAAEPGRAELQSDAAVPPEVLDSVTGVTRALGSADVLRLHIIGAPPARRGRLFRRKPRGEYKHRPVREVSLAVVTFVKATSPLTFAEAQALLERCRTSEGEQEKWIDEALQVVNKALRAYRAAAWDPYVIEVSGSDPRGITLGFGTPHELAAGNWRAAFAVGPRRVPRMSRAERLRPDQIVAAVLSRRAGVLHADDLLSRAQLDLELARARSAALQLRAAVEMLLAETREESLSSGFRQGLARLSDHRGSIDRLAAHALEGELPEDARSELERLVAEVGRVLYEWRSEFLLGRG